MLKRFPENFRLTPLAFAVAGVLAAGAFVVTNPSIVFSALQRDDTLTGRTPIWAAVSKLIGERPVGGYGWGATWDIGAPARVFVERSVRFEVPSAHNGYLDSALQIGIVGMALFVLIAIVVLLRGTRRMLAGTSTSTFWAPIFTLGLLTYNVAESSMVSTLSIFLLLTTLVHFSATRQRPQPALPI